MIPTSATLRSSVAYLFGLHHRQYPRITHEYVPEDTDCVCDRYGERIKVGGVVYMFPIYPNRITRNDRANTRVFQKICGKGNLTRIALATTRWSICPDKVGEGREAELRNNFWHEMLPQDKRASALLVRLDDSSNSASELLHAILGRLIESEHKKITDVALDIQEQIVKKERTIPETEAAKELRQKLLDLMAEATVGESPQQRKERLHNLMIQAKELKIPMLRRIANFFSSKVRLLLQRIHHQGISHDVCSEYLLRSVPWIVRPSPASSPTNLHGLRIDSLCIILRILLANFQNKFPYNL